MRTVTPLHLKEDPTTPELLPATPPVPDQSRRHRPALPEPSARTVPGAARPGSAPPASRPGGYGLRFAPAGPSATPRSGAAHAPSAPGPHRRTGSAPRLPARAPPPHPARPTLTHAPHARARVLPFTRATRGRTGPAPRGGTST
ncbi:hypothetical protein SNE510_51450 [Streptomyces sp. NE5-10]|nr:hypothetical protein SNE510_51450 [Streptomyces sp. NE5-10]